MWLKFLLFYPVWVLKTEKRNYPAPEATLPPPSPPSLVKHRAEQPSYISIKGERRLFWGQLGCRDVNAASGRSVGHRRGTWAATQPDTAWVQGPTKDRQQLSLSLTTTAQLARMGRDLHLCLWGMSLSYYPSLPLSFPCVEFLSTFLVSLAFEEGCMTAPTSSASNSTLDFS